MFVHNFIKLSAAVHESSSNRENWATMLKTILPSLSRAVMIEMGKMTIRFDSTVARPALYSETDVRR